MAQKFRPGSMGAAEQKAEKWWRAGTAVVAILVLLCFFVFKTDMHDLVKKANWFCNIAGFVVTSVGFAFFAFGESIVDRYDLDVRGFATAALALVGLGLLTATGFGG